MNKTDGIYVHGKKVRNLTKEDELFIDYMTLEQEKQSLVKYLKDKIKECDYQVSVVGNYQKICERRAYQDILERVRSEKYE